MGFGACVWAARPILPQSPTYQSSFVGGAAARPDELSIKPTPNDQPNSTIKLAKLHAYYDSEIRISEGNFLRSTQVSRPDIRGSWLEFKMPCPASSQSACQSL